MEELISQVQKSAILLVLKNDGIFETLTDEELADFMRLQPYE